MLVVVAVILVVIGMGRAMSMVGAQVIVTALGITVGLGVDTI